MSCAATAGATEPSGSLVPGGTMDTPSCCARRALWPVGDNAADVPGPKNRSTASATAGFVSSSWGFCAAVCTRAAMRACCICCIERNSDGFRKPPIVIRLSSSNAFSCLNPRRQRRGRLRRLSWRRRLGCLRLRRRNHGRTPLWVRLHYFWACFADNRLLTRRQRAARLHHGQTRCRIEARRRTDRCRGCPRIPALTVERLRPRHVELFGETALNKVLQGCAQELPALLVRQAQKPLRFRGLRQSCRYRAR